MKADALWLSSRKATDPKIPDVVAEGNFPEAVHIT
jgi:hypothetical protein